MPRRDETNEIVYDRIIDLMRDFDEYVDAFKRSRKWDGHPLHTHLRTMKMRCRLGIGEAIDSDDFLKSLRDTLVGWGMEARNARLVPLAEFKGQFREYKYLVMSIDGKAVSELDGYTGDLWRVIECLGLSETGSQIVTGSKALHHLLPELLPPITGDTLGCFSNMDAMPLSSHKISANRKMHSSICLRDFH